MVQLVRHPQTKERETDRLYLNHRATSLLYPFSETDAGSGSEDRVTPVEQGKRRGRKSLRTVENFTRA